MDKETGALVPADGNVFLQQQDVELTRSDYLHPCALQNRPLHPHLLQRKFAALNVYEFVLFLLMCVCVICVFVCYLSVLHSNQSSLVKDCDSFSTAMTHNSTGLVLHHHTE